MPLETPTSSKQQPERKSYDLRKKPTPSTRTSRTAEVEDKKRKREGDDDDSDKTLKSSLATRGKSAAKTPGDDESLVVRLPPNRPKGVYSHRGRAPGHLAHYARSSEAPSSSDADTDWDRPPTSAVGTKSAKAREEPTRASGKGGGHRRKKWLSPVAKTVIEKKETAASRRKPVSPSPASRKGTKAAIAVNRDKEKEQDREAKKAKRTVAGNMQGKAQTSAPNKTTKTLKEADRRIHNADLNDSDQEIDDVTIQAPVIEDQTVPPLFSAASERLRRGDKRRGQQKVAEIERAGSIQVRSLFIALSIRGFADRSASLVLLLSPLSPPRQTLAMTSMRCPSTWMTTSIWMALRTRASRHRPQRLHVTQSISSTPYMRFSRLPRPLEPATMSSMATGTLCLSSGNGCNPFPPSTAHLSLGT